MGDNRGNTSDFDEFVASGTVEVGDANLASQGEAPAKPAKPAAPRKGGAARAAQAQDAAGEAGTDEGDHSTENGEPADDEGADDEGEEGDEQAGRKRQRPSDRIRELNRRLRQSERLRLADSERLAELQAAQKPAGQAPASGGSADGIGEAPDPQDQKKYPLGHLDDRYIEDKLEWLSTKKAAERADAVLQRQQETQRQETQQQQQAALREKVDDLSDRGTDLYDDYRETVVDTAMAGEWPLTQVTFEAAHESDHGAQILYELANDPKEAKRVAGLSIRQQILFVEKRNTEIADKAKGRTKPAANAPPGRQPSGANSRTRINPATDNLDDFEKAWEADAKGHRR